MVRGTLARRRAARPRLPTRLMGGGRLDTIQWSATTCDYPGAGVYVGLAPDYEHMAVARGLACRQARVFVGGRMKFIPAGRPWAFNYYAVRDPSAVRVVPVSRPPLAGGFRHVELRVSINRNGQRDAIVVRPPQNRPTPDKLFDAHLGAAAGFLLTIGLPIEQEAGFFGRLIEEHVDQDWSDVYARLIEEGHRGEREVTRSMRRRAAP
jgi:hypothetical protein